MDQLGLKRYCCRRMIMTHVDLIEKLLKYVRHKLRQSYSLRCATTARARDRKQDAMRRPTSY